jgi:cation diffusion facilitator family transporter
MRQVCVVYEETRSGGRALQMAADLSRQFGGGMPLFVYVAVEDGGEKLLGTPRGKHVAQAMMRIQRLIADIVGERKFELHPYSAPEMPVLPKDALFVLPRVQKSSEDGDEPVVRLSQTFATACGVTANTVDIVMPADEVALQKRSGGPILVPFSDGVSGLLAAQAAFDLAEARRKTGGAPKGDEPEVILYHTTWPDAKGISPEAIDQMCEAAIRVMLAIEAAADKRGIGYRTIVETHDDVVQGVIEIAQNTRSVLVLMARSPQIRQGSYVGRTLQQSPIPVYVVRENAEQIGAPAGDERLEAFRTYRKEVLRAKAEQPRIPLWKRLADAPVLRNPMFVAGVVAVLYAIKAGAKIGVGSWINSPMITGDGFHNIADVLEIIAIGVVMFIAARQASERYPYGRKNMEWFTSLAIGIGLFVAAGNFVIDCVVGLLHYIPFADNFVRGIITMPAHEGVNMTGETFPWVLGITACSFLLSLVLSRYQMIANGEEAASDGKIEAVTVVGVIAQFVTGWGFLEYPLGLLVAFLIMRTAKELFMDGWRVLLQHSIGAEHESAIRSACEGVHGVSGISELKTFQVGHTAVVMVTCEALASSHGMTYIKGAVETAIRGYLLADDSDFKGADVHVKMQRPDPNRFRIGFAVEFHGCEPRLAASLDDMTHLAVCDVEHDDIVRTKLVPASGTVAELLIEKRVQQLYIFDEPGQRAQQLRGAVRQALQPGEERVVPIPELRQAAAYHLPVLGVTV